MLLGAISKTSFMGLFIKVLIFEGNCYLIMFMLNFLPKKKASLHNSSQTASFPPNLLSIE